MGEQPRDCPSGDEERDRPRKRPATHLANYPCLRETRPMRLSSRGLQTMWMALLEGRLQYKLYGCLSSEAIQKPDHSQTLCSSRATTGQEGSRLSINIQTAVNNFILRSGSSSKGQNSA